MSTDEPIIINGKRYSLWEQFVWQKQEWIGGILQEDGEDPTEITDITLEPLGTDSAMFSIKGKEYTCGFNVAFGGVGAPEGGRSGLHFRTPYSGFYAEKKENS